MDVLSKRRGPENISPLMKKSISAVNGAIPGSLPLPPAITLLHGVCGKKHGHLLPLPFEKLVRTLPADIRGMLLIDDKMVKLWIVADYVLFTQGAFHFVSFPGSKETPRPEREQAPSLQFLLSLRHLNEGEIYRADRKSRVSKVVSRHKIHIIAGFFAGCQ